MIVLILLVVAVGGMVEIVPLFFQKSTTEAITGLNPPTPLHLAWRDIYVREGCYNCHSQMIRPFRAETERYGHYSVAGEFVYDRPFQWGSKRTGPDLHRVGGKYSDEWHRIHLNNPRDLVPESNMPAYPWLEKTRGRPAPSIASHMRALRRVGVPYTDERDRLAPPKGDVKGKTEMDALVAYLQSPGPRTQVRSQSPWTSPPCASWPHSPPSPPSSGILGLDLLAPQRAGLRGGDARLPFEQD